MHYIGAPDGNRSMRDIERVGKRLDVVESSWSAYLGSSRAYQLRPYLVTSP